MIGLYLVVWHVLNNQKRSVILYETKKKKLKKKHFSVGSWYRNNIALAYLGKY